VRFSSFGLEVDLCLRAIAGDFLRLFSLLTELLLLLFSVESRAFAFIRR
jgi:hypothetical protein